MQTQIAEPEHFPDLAAPVRQDRSRRSLARIVAAAEEILRHDGVEGFSIAAIASSSGVSVGGIYARVKSKERLLHLVKETVTDRIGAAMGRALEAAGPGLDAVVDAYVDTLTSLFAADEDIHRALFMPGVLQREAWRSADDRKRAGVALYAAAVVRAEPWLAPFETTEVRFSGHMIAAMIVNLLSPAQAAVDWLTVNRNLKRAAKAYLHSLLNDAEVSGENSSAVPRIRKTV